VSYRQRLDQQAPPSSSVDFNAQTITSVADPAGAQDAATKNYVDTHTSSRNAPTIVAADHTMLSDDATVLVDASGVSRVIDLPLGPGPGFIYTVKKIDATANVVRVEAALTTGGNVDDQPFIDMGTQYQSLSCTFDGTNWWVV